ncbi:hypothetical protein FJY71_02635 [candidate division WOR-3 bacterium]|nr:hypothetical protein [candidate division WOR-3 bacterium]
MRYVRFAVVLLAAAGFLFTGCKKKLPKWTIMAYYDGNCDLDVTRNGNSWVVAEAQEAEEVGSTDEVQMIAMVGSVRLGGNCRYYRIEKNLNELPDSLKSTVLEELGTKAMSNPTVLRDFIQYCAANYPAEHYMLMIKNHGGGWRGACLDQQNGGGAMMTMPQIAQALDTFHFDIIAFDACLMSMSEVAYELRTKADYLVASQFVTYAGTFGSAEWLGWLTANPDGSALDLAKKIVTACMNANQAHQFTGHEAVTDLSKMDALASRMGTFANELVTASGQHGGEVLDAFMQTHSTQLDDPAFCDLLEFCNKIRQEPNLKLIPQIMTATTDVINALSDAVPMTSTNAVGISRGGHCVYIPYADTLFDSSNYVQLQWRSTNWHSFISKLIAALGGGGGGNRLTVSGTVTWPGHTLSNYCLAFLDTARTGAPRAIGTTQVNPANGSFTVQLDLSGPVQAYVEAFDDLNNNGYIETGEGFGYWDQNGNSQWDDYLTFQPGQTVQGANVVLFEVSQDGSPGRKPQE